MVSLLSEAPIQRETQRVILHYISWQTYQAMLADMGDRRSARLAYDRIPDHFCCCYPRIFGTGKGHRRR